MTGDYNQKLASLAAGVPGLGWLPSALSQKFIGQTRAYYSDGKGSYIHSPDSLIKRALHDPALGDPRRRFTICIIENISPSWMQAIGEAWALDPAFFIDHATNPLKDDIWNNIFNRNRDPMQLEPPKALNRVHITGVLGYTGWSMRGSRHLKSDPNFLTRHCWDGPRPYPVSSNTCISYCRVTSSFCMSFEFPFSGTSLSVFQ